MQFTLQDKWNLGLLSLVMSIIHFTVKFGLIFSFYKYLTSKTLPVRDNREKGR